MNRRIITAVLFGSAALFSSSHSAFAVDYYGAARSGPHIVDPEVRPDFRKDASILLGMVMDSNLTVSERVDACDRLGHLGPAASFVAPKLAGLLLTVTQVKPDPDTVFQDLTFVGQATLDGDPYRVNRFRTAIADAIGALGPDAADQTLDALRVTLIKTANYVLANGELMDPDGLEQDAQLCAACVRAMAAFGPKSAQAVPVLVQALEMRNSIFGHGAAQYYDLQQQVIEAAGKIGSPQFIPVLQRVRVTEPLEPLREAAETAIQQIYARKRS